MVLNGDMDKLNGPQRKNKLASKEITNQIEMLGLSDVFRELHPRTKKFTRYQSTPVVATRSDYFFVTKNLLHQIQECDIIPSIRSDHKIVKLILKQVSAPRGNSYWKFNNELLTDDQYLAKTKASISDFLQNNPSISTNFHIKVDLHSIRFCAFLRVLTQCVRRSVFLMRFLIYTVSVNPFFANARQNAPSIFVRFRVEPSSTFATNCVRQLRNWLAGLAVL